MTQPVYVVDYARTPIGRFGGAPAAIRPDDLAATVLGALVARYPGVDGRINDVYVGNGNGAGEENRNVARMAVLLAGLPVHVPGATVNRLCGSGLEAGLADDQPGHARGVRRLQRGGRRGAETYGIDRDRQDRFALSSHRKAAAAWESGRLAAETVPGPYDLTPRVGRRPGTVRQPLLK